MIEVIMRRVILLALLAAMTLPAIGQAPITDAKNNCDFWYAKVFPWPKVKTKIVKYKYISPAQKEAFDKDIKDAIAEWDCRHRLPVESGRGYSTCKNRHRDVLGS